LQFGQAIARVLVKPTCSGRCLGSLRFAKASRPRKESYNKSLPGDVGKRQKIIYTNEKRKLI